MRNARAASLFALCLLVVGGANSQQTTTYSYDALGRLTVSYTPYASRSAYVYDPTDNRASVDTKLLIITGTAGNDTLAGTDYTDQITTLAGNDVVISTFGGDSINGGTGWDQVSWGNQANHTFVWNSPSTSSVSYTPPNPDTVESLTSIELAYFWETGLSYPLGYLFPYTQVLLTYQGTPIGNGDDQINGTGIPGGVERINALGGNDLIAGFGGTDVIDGGQGIDTAFYGGNFCDYSFRAISAPFSGVLVHYDPSGETEYLINVEATYFAGTATSMNVSDLVANQC